MYNEKEYKRQYYIKNKTRLLKKFKKYRKLHKIEIARITKQWYIKHKKEISKRRKKYAKQYRLKNYEKIREYHKRTDTNRKLQQLYGISLKDKKKLYKTQKGKCLICKDIMLFDKRTHIDHNKITGKIRGLLCSNCNLGIGMFKENILILARAIKYLKKKNKLDKH